MTHHHNPPTPLAGIVTEFLVTISGAQTGGLDVHGAGTEEARLILRWGKLHMTFTTAEQVHVDRTNDRHAVGVDLAARNIR